jgi:hypothetical protein
MKFDDVGGGPISFVNFTQGMNALQFADSGITVELPTPTPWAQLLIGQFATDVTIEGLDSAGVVVVNSTVSKPNSYWFFTLSTNDLKTIRLAGGGNEASIAAISMLVL